MEPIPIADLLWMGMRDGRSRVPLGSCLGELAMARLAAGDRPGAGDLAHLSACGSCRIELAAVVSLLRDPAIRAGVAVSAHRPSRRRTAWATTALVAAAFAVIVLGRELLIPGHGRITRDPAASGLDAPGAIAPVGEVPPGTPFVWHGLPDASAYRVTIFDTAGTIVYEQRTADTVLVLPDAFVLVPGNTYQWQVESRTGWDHWAAGPLIEFRVAGSTPHRERSAAPPDSVGATEGSPSFQPTSPSPQGGVRRPDPDLRADYRVLLRTAARDSLELDQLVARYELSTGDAFLRSDLARFRRWPATARATRLRTDSIRVAGVGIFGSDGPRAAMSVWQDGIRLAQAMHDTVAEGALRGNVGAAMAREGMLADARRELERARQLARGVNDLRTVANATAELAGIEEQSGSVARARELYAEAITLRGKTADQRGLASDYNNLGILLRTQGNVDEARTRLEQARRVNRALGRRSAEATNLVNIAGLATLAGESGRAEADLDEALGIWREAGDSAEMVNAWFGLAEVAVQRGAHADAASALRSAVRVLLRTGPVPDELIARQRLAAVLVGAGNLQAARDEWEVYRARRARAGLAEEIGATLDLGDGDLLAQLDRPADALAAYRRAVEHYAAVGHEEGLGAARQGLARLLATRGDVQQAMTLLGQALAEQRRRGDIRAAGLSAIALGDMALDRGDAVLSRRHYAWTLDSATGLADPVTRAHALAGLARIEAMAGQHAAGERIVRRAMSLVAGGVSPDLSWQLSVQLADFLQARGDGRGARKALRAAIATLDSLRLPIRESAHRTGLRNDAAGVYARLAGIELSAGDVSAAFAATEAGRAREMASLMDRGRIDVPNDATGKSIAREQQLRFQLAAAQPDSAPRRVPAPSTRRAELATVREALHRDAPSYASLIDEAPIDWKDVASRLPADAAMIEFLVTDSAVITFVIRRDSVRATTAAMAAPGLAAKVAFARAAIEMRRGTRWVAPMRELHDSLIGPAERRGWLRGVTHLVIVPHRTLHYLPFAALLARPGAGSPEGEFLVERFDILTVPSAAVWIRSAGRPAAAARGTLAFAPHPRDLPATRAELTAVTSPAGETVRRLAGPAATESAFRREASRQRVIHLAANGVFNRENPMYSRIDLRAGDGHDGRLEVREIFGLKLAADLVVLAACQTAVGGDPSHPVPMGDDLVGLTRAFLAAGARNVVGSLWRWDPLESTCRHASLSIL